MKTAAKKSSSKKSTAKKSSSKKTAAKKTAAKKGSSKKTAAKKTTAKKSSSKKTAAKKAAPSTRPTKPKLLSGGNPQIAKAEGDAPVQAYIAALPGWKSELGRRVDALITRTVPGVKKAVKWNSPFYGIEGQGWFLSFHAFTRYLKLTFFKGSSLSPLPPGESKHQEVRYLDIHETDKFDEKQLATWIRQAAAVPGWIP